MSRDQNNLDFVKAFQQRTGLTADGWAGPATRKKLDEVVPLPEPTAIDGKFQLSARSRANLAGVHADLVKVVERAIALTEVDFVITEGLRTRERQKQLVAKGASQTMNSRHITGHAVDVAALIDGEVRWDWPLYEKIAKAFKQASADLNIPIVWGGDWRTLKDGPHYELDRKVYP